MCGVFGYWNRDGRPVDIKKVVWATTSLRHRGPDDEGYLLARTATGDVVRCGGKETDAQLTLPRIESFMGQSFDLAFGFRRLAILDLSCAGHQPMSTHDQRYWIVYNGEVYNWLDLRHELQQVGHRFQTQTDTEVVLASYARWGPQCVERFNGMWAFAIWDNWDRSLFLARDRFGIKPLYIVIQPDGRFLFASEIKALIVSGLMEFRPHLATLGSYVALGKYPDPFSGETFLEGIQCFPPSHWALITAHRCTIQRYWRLPPPTNSSGRSTTDLCRRYGELFEDAVRLCLRADVPIGTCLSGGVDSSSLVVTIGRLYEHEYRLQPDALRKHQKTFSAIYNTDGIWNEEAFVRVVINSNAVDAHFVHPDTDRLWREIEQLVWYQDEPFQSLSMFAQWCVMNSAHAQGVKVLLDGQGADEILGGYHPFPAYLQALVRNGRLFAVIQTARQVAGQNGTSALRLFAQSVRQATQVFITEALCAMGLRHPSHSRSFRDNLHRSLLQPELQTLVTRSFDIRMPSSYKNLHEMLSQWVQRDPLPVLLRYEDRNSMAHSIEARVPFLDYRLVEFLFHEADSLRLREGWTKWIHRKALEPMLPREIAWRREKVGFETPEQRWLLDSKPMIEELFHDATTCADYLQIGAIQKSLPVIFQQLLDKKVCRRLWRWMNVCLWVRAYTNHHRFSSEKREVFVPS